MAHHSRKQVDDSKTGSNDDKKKDVETAFAKWAEFDKAVIPIDDVTDSNMYNDNIVENKDDNESIDEIDHAIKFESLSKLNVNFKNEDAVNVNLSNTTKNGRKRRSRRIRNRAKRNSQENSSNNKIKNSNECEHNELEKSTLLMPFSLSQTSNQHKQKSHNSFVYNLNLKFCFFVQNDSSVLF